MIRTVTELAEKPAAPDTVVEAAANPVKIDRYPANGGLREESQEILSTEKGE